MSFREDFPDYERYRDGPLYYTKVPPGVVPPLKGVILRVVRSAHHLNAVCNDVASRVPCEPTQHVGWDWLVNDLTSMLERVVRKKLYKFMDFIHDLTREHGNARFVADLNDIFDANDFGYRMILNDRGCGEKYRWDIRRTPE